MNFFPPPHGGGVFFVLMARVIFFFKKLTTPWKSNGASFISNKLEQVLCYLSSDLLNKIFKIFKTKIALLKNVNVMKGKKGAAG